jgi:hypothetical protein
MLLQGGVVVESKLCVQCGFQGGSFLRRTAWNGFDGHGASLAPLLEIPLDRRHRDLKGAGHLGLAMPLIHCMQKALA